MSGAYLRRMLLDELRELSGSIDSKDKLVEFLYELMRDHVPVGVIEGILENINHGHTVQYTNGYLAKYAMHVADWIRLE